MGPLARHNRTMGGVKIVRGLMSLFCFLGSLFGLVAYVWTFTPFDQSGVATAILWQGALWLVIGLPIFLYVLSSTRHWSSKGMMPRWTKWPMAVVFLPVIISFCYSVYRLEFGSLREEQGRYTLQNHARVVRHLSQDEYHELKRYENRLPLGHLTAFWHGTALLWGWGSRERKYY